MMTFPWRFLMRSATIVLCTLIVACENSDVIAPDGATISMTPNPATIVLSGGVQSAPVTIVATVSNSIGVPLPGQDVRFTTTAGILDPVAGIPITTDSFGNATTILTEARQQATITARSGKATKDLQIQTATCNLNSIVLSPGPLDLNTCNDSYTLTAVAKDTSGATCTGILINFALAGTGSTDVSGSFNPPSDTTDVNGVATTTFTISSTDCNSKCVGKPCTGSVKATAGATTSNTVIINDNVS